MYCLDCGRKIGDDELQCPHCGSSVAEMRERIAEAAEKIAYTDAVNPSDTSKLPLVSQRSYVDSEGKPLDPSKEVDLKSVRIDEHDLTAIPEIGDADPYITKPMPKIVSGTGAVVAGADTQAKVYRQAAPKKRFPVRAVVVVIIIAALAVLAVAFGPQLAEQVQGAIAAYEQEEQVESPAQSTEASQATEEVSAEDALAEFQDSLASAYIDLGAWRTQVDEAVDGLEGYYRVKNRDTRTAYADSCTQLIDTITASREELAAQAEAAGVVAGTEGYESYEKIDELYGYLLDRLSVIWQCWEVSLTYDAPSGHDSEILAPLTQDLSQGSSVSEAAFDELYPEADPALSS